jgi:hypothetical protein
MMLVGYAIKPDRECILRGIRHCSYIYEIGSDIYNRVLKIAKSNAIDVVERIEKINSKKSRKTLDTTNTTM